ncbi:hypothetical protein IPJ72_07060 [Candidatus Peregrinibacteria bacterium]|nr:MAG: hypothetical protein IPJ72_07060 [Candidatus Peregrinibacteria bacterium]
MHFNAATASLIGTPADRGKLLTPEQACKAAPDLKQVIEASSPLTLLDPLLATYYDYAAFQTDTVNTLSSQLNISPTGRLSAVVDSLNQQQQRQQTVDNEIQNALLGLNSAFLSLKELRRAYVMHVHFQCMLQSLDSYRRLMSNIRSVVSLLPDLLIDASTHK